MSPNRKKPLSRRAARSARHTTGEQPAVDTSSAPVEETTTSGGPILDADGQPLTRRRLRELRATGVIPTLAAEPAPPAAPADAPDANAAAPAARDTTTVAEHRETSDAAGPYAPPERRAPETGARYFRPSVTGSVPDAAQVPSAPDGDPTAAQPEPRTTAPQTTGQGSAFAPSPKPTVVPTVPSWTAPAGHWTRQLELEDDIEMTASREVGSTSTASTLVVSEVPTAHLGSPLNETGQLLVTGSISLRPEFAATGALTGTHGTAGLEDHYDDDHPTTGGVAAPVRATAVASQHALGTPIIAGAKPRGSRAINVLLVTASVLAVLVTGLVVTAIVLRWI